MKTMETSSKTLHMVLEVHEVLTFASSERGDLSGSGSDVVDDGVLEPGYPEDTRTHQLNQSLSLVLNSRHQRSGVY